MKNLFLFLFISISFVLFSCTSTEEATKTVTETISTVTNPEPVHIPEIIIKRDTVKRLIPNFIPRFIHDTVITEVPQKLKAVQRFPFSYDDEKVSLRAVLVYNRNERSIVLEDVSIDLKKSEAIQTKTKTETTKESKTSSAPEVIDDVSTSVARPFIWAAIVSGIALVLAALWKFGILQKIFGKK